MHGGRGLELLGSAGIGIEMSLPILVLLGLGFVLAFVNGANDVSKGIATLAGSGVSDYRRAIFWGALWTAGGSLFGAVAAKALVATFGSGLLAPGVTPSLDAAAATLFGAAAWVLFATWTGLPVSTTHAIVGAIVGVAATAYGVEGVRWSALGEKIFLPLLASPVVSLLLAVILIRATRGRPESGGQPADCLCAEVQPAAIPVAALPGAVGAVAFAAQTAELQVIAGTAETCAVEHPQALRLTLDHLHWLTSGATSFARGMNDAPKIVALVLGAAAWGSSSAVSTPLLFLLITTGMVSGSLFAGQRVTHVLAEEITPMDHQEGFVANLVTATLVAAGAVMGLPMSTTHVSSGGIVAAGVQRGGEALNRRTVGDMLLAWVITLPAAAALGMAAYGAARAFHG